MKVCVYAIAKNEAQFVDRWMDAVDEADYICVLDTGSTDDTAQLLARRGAVVRREIIDPWRFDVARNRSLTLVPQDTDICVCVDLDDVLSPGWRSALEAAWTPGTEQARYMIVCGRNADGTPGTSFLMGKIHRPGLFVWRYPVHEVLVRCGGRAAWPVADVPDMVVEHRPDPAKSRAGYLPLLELAAQEEPQDARCAHYLGREYMYYRRWEDAILELERHLSLPAAAWRDERAASMRYLAHCHAGLGDNRTAMSWALRSLAETPELRESWYAAEKAAYFLGDWEAVVYYGRRAAAIRERSGSGISEGDAWGSAVPDLLSLGYWHTGQAALAVQAARAALELDPGNERIQANLAFYRRGGGP